ncbi:MAG: hypothetical protein K1Y02_14235 [Candidatus Hydrogenedentes bacterium]|nr:hypothetical protein [Candidatus Hydrogenedentota bacterium]
MQHVRAVIILMAVILAVPFAGADIAIPQTSYNKPVADDVYLQENRATISTKTPITALAAYNDALFAVVDGSLRVLQGDSLKDVGGAPSGILRMRVLDGALWAATAKELHRYDGKAWARVADLPIVDLCMHVGKVHAATRDAIYRYEDGKLVDIKPATGYLSNDSTVVMDDGTQVLMNPVSIAPIDRIASYSGTLYILRPGGIALLDRAKFIPNPIDWGEMLSRDMRDMMAQGSRLYVTTGRGVAVIRGMALTTLTGAEGLPYHDTTCLAEGFDGDLWIGTTKGAIRRTGNAYHYFGYQHWLPGDNVHDIAVSGHTVYIATDGGLGIIRYEPYTLLKKAAYFERELNEWGHKRLGFIHQLYWDSKNNEWVREISDNDGGNSAEYLAALCFKYAVTKDESVRAAAVDAFEAIIWLDAITPKDGFIARAIWSVKGDKGQMAEGGSGGLPAKWYPTDDGLWYWKGDTSSDEVNGHIFSVALFYELVAQGPEKERAKKHLTNIASHIMDNGWVLRDMDDKPTRWGRWDPDYLLKPYGFDARGLNGMEAQTYMWTASAVSGDPKFQQGLQQLLKWGYQEYTVRQKLTFPPDLVVPWDDELAFRCYFPLLCYANDPELRSIYLRSLERSWEVQRMQHVPLFNFMYGGLTGNDCEADRAAEYLRDFPLDCVGYSYRNSFRDDLAPEPGYVPYGGGTRGISPRETKAMWGSQNALHYDGGDDGKSVTPPIGWLQGYWMGRYFGFIKAPDTTDVSLTTVPASSGQSHGAAPYDGPPRPTGLIPAK